MRKKDKPYQLKWTLLGMMALCMVFFLRGVPTENLFHGKDDLARIDDGQKDEHPKIESHLYKLNRIYLTEGELPAQEFAHRHAIDLKENFVRAAIDVLSERRGEKINAQVFFVTQQVEAMGGNIETSYGQTVQAFLPLGSLELLAELPSVSYIGFPLMGMPEEISEGVFLTGANLWHSANPYRTTEAKVCILDSGFDGYEALLGKELPSSVKTRSFTSNGSLFGTKHGTGCAEIVHDMAPGTKLWLVNHGTSTELGNAVDYLISEGIDVVSYSIGWHNAGAGDGTGPICEVVKKASGKGIIWVKSAGNAGQRHWEGTFADLDEDGWHEYSPGDELYAFWVSGGSSYSIYLNWNDWGKWDGSNYGGSNQDYDLYLYGEDYQLIGQSRSIQDGTQWPVERISELPSKSGWRFFAIRSYKASKPSKLEIYLSAGSNLEYQVASGSITIPGDSPDAVAVGATDWADDSLHSYSSQGPTEDGRMKPDLGAPSGVSGISYGKAAFFGTSAACPHVAGAFALLKGKTAFTLEQVSSVLNRRALDLGPSGSDNQFGHGRLNLK